MPNITTNQFHGDFIYKDGVCYEYVGESFGQPSDDNNGIVEFSDCEDCLNALESSDSSFAITFAPPCVECAAPHSGDPHYTFGSFFHMFDQSNPGANINRCSLNVDDNVQSDNELIWFHFETNSGEEITFYYTTYDFPFTVGGRSMKSIRYVSSIYGETVYDIDEVDNVYTINGESAGRFVLDSFTVADSTMNVNISVRTITDSCAPEQDHLMYSLSLIPTDDWSSNVSRIGGALWYIWKKAATFASGPVNNPSEAYIDGIGLFLNGFDGYNQRGDFESVSNSPFQVSEPFSSAVMASVMNKLNELSQIAGLADFDWDPTMATTCLDEIPAWDALGMTWETGELKRFPDTTIHEDHYDAIRIATEERAGVDINDGSLYPDFGMNDFPSRFSSKMTETIAQSVMNRIDSILEGTDTIVEYKCYINNLSDNDWDSKDEVPVVALSMNDILSELGQTRIPASEWETEEWVLQQYDILNRMQWVRVGASIISDNTFPVTFSNSVNASLEITESDFTLTKSGRANNSPFDGCSQRKCSGCSYEGVFLHARDNYVNDSLSTTSSCHTTQEFAHGWGTQMNHTTSPYNGGMTQQQWKVHAKYLFDKIPSTIDWYLRPEKIQIELDPEDDARHVFNSFTTGYQRGIYVKFSTTNYEYGDSAFSPANIKSEYTIAPNEQVMPMPVLPPVQNDESSIGWRARFVSNSQPDYFAIAKPEFQFFDPEIQGGNQVPDTMSSTSSSSSSSSSLIDGGNPCYPNPSIAVTITGGTGVYPRYVAGEFIEEGETTFLCPDNYAFGKNVNVPASSYYYGGLNYISGELWEKGNVNNFGGTGIQFRNAVVVSKYCFYSYYCSTNTDTFNNMMFHTAANSEKGIKLWYEGTPFGGNSQIGTGVSTHNILRGNFGSLGSAFRAIPDAQFGPVNFGQITLNDGTLITWQRSLGNWGIDDESSSS